MREHDSRLLKSINRNNDPLGFSGMDNWEIYVDSNKFPHRLEGPAIIVDQKSPKYFIHGKEYTKEQWELEVNRIKTLEEM